MQFLIAFLIVSAIMVFIPWAANILDIFRSPKKKMLLMSIWGAFVAYLTIISIMMRVTDSMPDYFINILEEWFLGLFQLPVEVISNEISMYHTGEHSLYELIIMILNFIVPLIFGAIIGKSTDVESGFSIFWKGIVIVLTTIGIIVILTLVFLFIDELSSPNPDFSGVLGLIALIAILLGLSRGGEAIGVIFFKK